MKALAQALLNEQIQLNRKPAVKFRVQAYDFPTESTDICFNQYDWRQVLSTSKGAAAACCASDGSFVITAGTGATTVRFTSVDMDTDFTTWGASGTEGTFAAGNTFCIGANPTSNEVIIAYLSGGHLYRQTSTNYGASFDAAVDMGAYSNYGGDTFIVRMAYTPTGNVAIVVGQMGYNSANSLPYEVKIAARIRRGGSWSTWIWGTFPCSAYKFNLGYSYGYYDWQGKYQTTWVYYAVVIESMDIAYDDDWFITYSASQEKPGSEGGQGRPVSVGTIIYGLYGVTLGNGTNATSNLYTSNAEISLVDTKVNITSLSQLSHFSPSPPTKEELTQEQTTMPILLERPELLRAETVHPAAYLHKISGYPLLISLYADGKCYLCELQRGTTILTAIFDKAFTFNNDRPVKLTSNSSYLFAYNGDQIWMSPLPGYWSVPSIGTGAGDYFDVTTNILSIKESVNPGQRSTLDIMVNNRSGEWDAPGSGGIDDLALGSKVILYEGYVISSVSTYQEAQSYFVDSWSYSRSPNLATFTIHCIDAWGLLEKYRFNRKVSFNYTGATTTYSVYELIEMLCQAIGGSLSYISRSSFIITFKPVIEINAGETAANLLRRLLATVPDTIRFDGNTGYVVYPQSGDQSSYLLKFPVT